MKRSHIFKSLTARDSQTRVTLRQYGTLFVTYLGPQWFRVVCMALLLVGSIVLELLGPQIIRTFIDTAQRSGSGQVLTIIALLYLGTAIGGRLVSACASFFSENVGWNATNQWRADLARHCLNLDRSFHTAHTPGELLERVDSDVERLSDFFSQFVIRILGSGILMLGILVLMMRENIWLGASMGMYLILSNIAFVYVQQRATSIYQLHWQAEAELSGFWGELFHALEDIAASGAARYIMRRYFHLQRRENSTEIKSIVFWAGFECTGLILDVLSMLIVLILSAYFFVHGLISLGTLVMLLTYTAQLLDHTYDLVEQLGSLQQATASIERINEIYHAQSCVLDGPGVTFPTGALALSPGFFLVMCAFVFGMSIETLIALFIMVRINMQIMVIAILPLLVGNIIVNLLGKRVEHYRRRSSEASSAVSNYLVEMFGVTQAVQVAGATNSVITRFHRLNDQRRVASLREHLFSNVVLGVFDTGMDSIGTGLVLLLAGSFLHTGSFTVGDFTLFVAYMGTLARFSSELINQVTRYRQLAVAKERLIELMPGAAPTSLVTPDPVYQWATASEMDLDIPRIEERFARLEVRMLGYHYPGTT